MASKHVDPLILYNKAVMSLPVEQRSKFIETDEKGSRVRRPDNPSKALAELLRSTGQSEEDLNASSQVLQSRRPLTNLPEKRIEVALSTLEAVGRAIGDPVLAQRMKEQLEPLLNNDSDAGLRIAHGIKRIAIRTGDKNIVAKAFEIMLECKDISPDVGSEFVRQINTVIGGNSISPRVQELREFLDSFSQEQKDAILALVAAPGYVRKWPGGVAPLSLTGYYREEKNHTVHA